MNLASRERSDSNHPRMNCLASRERSCCNKSSQEMTATKFSRNQSNSRYVSLLALERLATGKEGQHTYVSLRRAACAARFRVEVSRKGSRGVSKRQSDCLERGAEVSRKRSRVTYRTERVYSRKKRRGRRVLRPLILNLLLLKESPCSETCSFSKRARALKLASPQEEPAL